jgi:hypothetical protein
VSCCRNNHFDLSVDAFEEVRREKGKGGGEGEFRWNSTSTATSSMGSPTDPNSKLTKYALLLGTFYCFLSAVHSFLQLAHPSYGVMPLEYRPVDCDTNQPLT